MVRQFKFCLVCQKTGYNLNGAELKGYLPPNLLRLHQAIWQTQPGLKWDFYSRKVIEQKYANNTGQVCIWNESDYLT